MKYKLIALVGLAVVFSAHTPAYAEETGAWVKVNANGEAIGQAIVCTPSVCGNPNSLYNQLTLGANEQYVLQNPATPDGNVSGVGAGQGPTSVKVDLETKVWTITNESKVIDPISREVIGTQTTQQRYDRTLQNPIETKVIDNRTVNNSTTINQYAKIMAEYQRWLDEINKWFYLTFGYKLGGNK
jgi:hypothetical protein